MYTSNGTYLCGTNPDPDSDGTAKEQTSFPSVFLPERCYFYFLIFLIINYKSTFPVYSTWLRATAAI